VRQYPYDVTSTVFKGSDATECSLFVLSSACGLENQDGGDFPSRRTHGATKDSMAITVAPAHMGNPLAFPWNAGYKAVV